MTQIISAVTKEYALLVSDRRLTFGQGPKIGQLFDDDTCKLVSLCNTCGIGYSGLAHIEGSPTHEWIAKTLAAANCRDPGLASRILAESAGRALHKLPSDIRCQTFLITGWANFEDLPGVRSHFCTITNCLDESYRPLATPLNSFRCGAHALPDTEEILWFCIGQPLRRERGQLLDRNLRRLVDRQIGPKEALRLLTDEIINTSVREKCASVGSKVLGFCIPRRAVQRQIETGVSMMLAKVSDESDAAFTYFDAGYSELQQYGPTFICGDFAVTDIKTENDPAREFQSSEFRFLSVPKPKT